MQTISFETIRKIHRAELEERKKLTKLPPDFFAQARRYLEQKKKQKERKEVIEAKSIENLLIQIFDLRQKKIGELAQSYVIDKIVPENLTEEEKKFFDSLVSLLEARRRRMLEELKVLAKKELARLAIFKEEVPQFVGIDEKVYGPFKKGDIARIPEENLRLLVEKGFAEEIKVLE